MGHITNQYFFLPGWTKCPSLSFNFHCWAPRTYPPHFGLRLVKLFPALVESKSPPPEIPASVADMDTKQFFDDLPWDEDVWADANMVSCLAYLRGNRNLKIGEWRDSFPQALWPFVATKMCGIGHIIPWISKTDVTIHDNSNASCHDDWHTAGVRDQLSQKRIW